MPCVTKKRRVADPNVESSDEESPRTPVARIPSTTVKVCHESNIVVVKLMNDFEKWKKEDAAAAAAAKKLVEAAQPAAKKPKTTAKTALDVLTQHFDCTPESSQNFWTIPTRLPRPYRSFSASTSSRCTEVGPSSRSFRAVWTVNGADFRRTISFSTS